MKLRLSLSLALVVFTVPVQAVVVNGTFSGRVTDLSDDLIENNTIPGASSIVNLGDSVTGVFSYDTLLAPPGGPLGKFGGANYVDPTEY